MGARLLGIDVLPRERQRRALFHKGWTVMDNGCWEANGPRHRKGHVWFTVKNGKEHGGGQQTVAAHRVMFDHYRQELGPGDVVRHRCDNPPCVNPAHLVVGSIADNNRDMFERGRSAMQQQTHCKRGHGLNDPDNQVKNKGVLPGHRKCAECKRIKGREYAARRRGE